MPDAASTNSGKPASQDRKNSVPTNDKRSDGQFEDHWVLPDAERAAGFIRPVRTHYIHLICKTVTSMPIKIAETYARDPEYYGKTFCCGCGDYFPVGKDGEFIWDEKGEKVGT